jgi:hypothetical protein
VRSTASSPLTIVVSGMIAADHHQGGATWAVLQYVLGLRELGHRVLLVEPIKPSQIAPSTAALGESINASYFRRVGGEPWVVPTGSSPGTKYGFRTTTTSPLRCGWNDRRSACMTGSAAVPVPASRLRGERPVASVACYAVHMTAVVFD